MSDITSTRLEMFSDGVLAIIITIMVLELKVPHSPDAAALLKLWPTFFSYVLSFVYLAIYWNNHHHLFLTAARVNGGILWANMHLLFWLSLVPFVTGWMGENPAASLPSAMYGAVLLMASAAFYLLQNLIIREHGKEGLLGQALLGHDLKGKLSPFLYCAAIASSFIAPWIAWAIYAFVACLWLVPDRRIEKMVVEAEEEEKA